MRRFSALAFRSGKSQKFADLLFLQQAADVPTLHTKPPKSSAEPPTIQQTHQNHQQNHPPPPTSHSHDTPHTKSPHQSPDQSRSPNPALPPRVLNTTRAMKKLVSAVLRRDYSGAERLFEKVPRLAERPAAMRLLIKCYCEQWDFVSARALLRQSQHQVGDSGTARYIAHCTYTARNSTYIREALQWSLARHARTPRTTGSSPISPELVATALNGLLFLGERALYEQTWQEVAAHLRSQARSQPGGRHERKEAVWNIDRVRETLHSQVLRALLDEQWPDAERLWLQAQRVASYANQASASASPAGTSQLSASQSSARQSGDEDNQPSQPSQADEAPTVNSLTVWYIALRYFFTEARDASAAARVLALMRELGVALTPMFTTLLMRHLPPLLLSLPPGPAPPHARGAATTNDQSALDWLAYARDQGWPLEVSVAEQLLHAAWAARLPENVFRGLREHMVRYIEAHTKNIQGTTKLARQKLASGERVNPFRRRILQARDDTSVLAELELMRKRGVVPGYALLVQAFETALRLAPAYRANETLANLSALLRRLGYPLHCAGIDLTVVEMHARNQKFDIRVVRALLAEYLAQYPLLNNNISQLTRLGVLLINANEPASALAVADSMREAQVGADREVEGGEANAASNPEPTLSDNTGSSASPSTSSSTSTGSASQTSTSTSTSTAVDAVEDPYPDFSGISYTNHDSASLQVLGNALLRLDRPLGPLLATASRSGIYFDRSFLRKTQAMLARRGERADVIIPALVRANEQLLAAARREAEAIVDQCI